MNARVTFRNIKTEDFDFLWRLKNAALKDYVAQTFGWDEEYQARRFEREFSTENGKIIVVDGKDAGLFWVNEKKEETFLVSIHLMPEFQNKGIGTKIIGDLLEHSEKPVTLQVLKVNPARKLYERLGFKVYDETATHFLMKFTAETLRPRDF